MQVSVSLLNEGKYFFDLLKATVREWQSSNWEHEKRRARYAIDLYERSLTVYREYLNSVKAKVEQGYNTELDRKLVADLESDLVYWEKKLVEIINKRPVTLNSQ